MKIFLKFCIVAAMVLTFIPATISYAEMYPATLENGNLVLVDGGMGSGRYAIRSSVEVQQYAPPNYQIAIQVVSVNFSDEYFQQYDTYIGAPYTILDTDYLQFRFRYNWNNKTFQFESFENHWEDWNFNYDYSHAEGYPLIPYTAEVAFVAAYNKRFLNDKLQYSPVLKESSRLISEEFYERLGV